MTQDPTNVNKTCPTWYWTGIPVYNAINQWKEWQNTERKTWINKHFWNTLIGIVEWYLRQTLLFSYLKIKRFFTNARFFLKFCAYAFFLYYYYCIWGLVLVWRQVSVQTTSYHKTCTVPVYIWFIRKKRLQISFANLMSMSVHFIIYNVIRVGV